MTPNAVIDEIWRYLWVLSDLDGWHLGLRAGGVAFVAALAIRGVRLIEGHWETERLRSLPRTPAPVRLD